jgi:hypothetical protein
MVKRIRFRRFCVSGQLQSQRAEGIRALDSSNKLDATLLSIAGWLIEPVALQCSRSKKPAVKQV